MMMNLQNKIAIITGSSSGIGRVIAHRFVEEGARVAVVGLDEGRIDKVVRELAAKGGEAVGVQADVGYGKDVDRVFEITLQSFGGLDVLVNNAAWVTPRTHLLELDDEHWDKAVRTNLKSTFLCTSRAAKRLVQQGRGGSIVSTTSLGGSRAHRMMAAYDASKGGIEAFTRAAALDLAPFGIRVNAVCPGWIRDDRFDSLDEATKRRRSEVIPLGRLGFPEEIASAVAFLSSGGASYITGHVLCVDGGVKAQLRTPSDDVTLPESLQP